MPWRGVMPERVSPGDASLHSWHLRGPARLFCGPFWSGWAAVGSGQEEPGKAGGRCPYSQGGSLNCGLGREDYRAEAERGTADEEVEHALDVPFPYPGEFLRPDHGFWRSGLRDQVF